MRAYICDSAALLVMNRQRCQPPLLDAEVARIARSVARYEPANGEKQLAPNKSPQTKEDALAYVGDTLGLPELRELPLRGDTYEMRVGDKCFPIGDVNALMCSSPAAESQLALRLKFDGLISAILPFINSAAAGQSY
jgi:hypothetical protein